MRKFVMAGLVLALLGGQSMAQTGTNLAQRCAAKKISVLARKARSVLECHARAALGGKNVDPICLQRVEEKYERLFAAVEAIGGCFIYDDWPVVATRLEECTGRVACEVKSSCCDGQRMVLTGVEGGTIELGGVGSFPFPLGSVVAVDVAASPDTSCTHEMTVDNFMVPTFCIPAPFNMSADLLPTGCAGGSGVGRGTVWDGYACCPDADVTTLADSRDGTCNPGGQTCAPSPGGAAANQLGDVDVEQGDGVCDAFGGVQTRVEIPVRAVVWQSPGGCPDPDGAYTPGTDALVSQVGFTLRATTGTVTAGFVDENEDGCAFAGLGPAGPITLTGSPAPGRCYCDGGDDTGLTLVAAGPLLTGAGPGNDLLYRATIPMKLTDCAPPPPNPAACTLDTADQCAN